MRALWCIARREIGAYFKSPVAYVVLAAFVMISGVLFFRGLFVNRIARMDGFFGTLPLLFWLFGPAVAMRLIAEERGSGTIELLLTMPVRDRDIVLGKYFAALVLLAVALLATTPFALSVSALGELDPGPVIGGYLGALLLGAVYIAAGLFASSLTKNQVLAFVGGLAMCFPLLALQVFVDPGEGGRFMQYASPQFHFLNLTRGFLEIRTLVYFASVIAMFVVMSIQAVEARKWR